MSEIERLESVFGAEPQAVRPAAPLPSSAITDAYESRLRRLGSRWTVFLDTVGEAGYPSASEADMALIDALVKRNFTDGEIWRTLEGSARYRDRVERKGERHARRLYENEIAKARAHVTPFPDDPPPPRLVLPNGNGHYEPDPQSRPAPMIGPAWPVLNRAALYGLAGEIVAALDPYTEADPVALLFEILASAGNMAGSGPHWQVSGRKHGLRLFGVYVGETSKGRKGTARGTVAPVLRCAAPEWANTRIASGLSSGEGLIWAVRDPINKTEPVKEHGKVVDYQEVCVDQGVSDKRLLVYEEEFAGVIKQMSRESNILSVVLRQAWDDGNLRTLTKNSPAVATGAHISLVGHITRDELLRYLTSTEAGNGFANRFLWLCVRRSKLLPEGGNPDPELLWDFGAHVANVLRTAERIGLIERDDDATDLWRQVYGPLSEGGIGLLGAVTSRAEAQVMRLAAIYALLDETNLITVEHLRAALAVWDYAAGSAQYIFGDAMGDPIADAILSYLRQMGEATRSDISHGLFGRNQSAARIDRALTLLSMSGKARCETRPADSATGQGRPQEVWRPA